VKSWATAAALALSSCTPEEGPLMAPGRDCMVCHHEGAEAKAWTVCGTVYGAAEADALAGIREATVRVTDAKGWTFSLTSNQAGNFYSAEPVAYPLTLCVVRAGASLCMLATDTHGSCNTCHTSPPGGGAAGRLYAP
jgi:hypothetical protein